MGKPVRTGSMGLAAPAPGQAARDGGRPSLGGSPASRWDWLGKEGFPLPTGVSPDPRETKSDRLNLPEAKVGEL